MKKDKILWSVCLIKREEKRIHPEKLFPPGFRWVFLGVFKIPVFGHTGEDIFSPHPPVAPQSHPLRAY